MKTAGNQLFVEKKYTEAIDWFTSGINFYKENGSIVDHEGIKLLMTQMFTNRSLAHHLMD